MLTKYLTVSLWRDTLGWSYEYEDDGKDQIVLIVWEEGVFSPYPRGYVLPSAYSLASAMIHTLMHSERGNKAYEEFEKYVTEFFECLARWSDIRKLEIFSNLG